MSSVVRFEDLDIPALTMVAQEQFDLCVCAIGQALTRQLEFGRVMLIVKSKLPHGEWGKWVRETFQDQMSLRNIQFHMKAHQEVAKNPSLLEFANSLDEILTLTEKPRQPSVKVIEVAASSPESRPATVERKVRQKSQSVIQIEVTIRNLKRQNRHDELVQIASLALNGLAPERRGEVLTRQLLNLTPELLSEVFETVERRQNETPMTV